MPRHACHTHLKWLDTFTKPHTEVQLHTSLHLRDIVALRILHSDWPRGFFAITQEFFAITQVFPDMQKSKKSTQESIWFLSKKLQKTSFLCHFFLFFGPLGFSWLEFCLSSAASICFYKIILHQVWSKFSLECSPVNLYNCCTY